MSMSRIVGWKIAFSVLALTAHVGTVSAQVCRLDNSFLFAGVAGPAPNVIPQVRNPVMVDPGDPDANYVLDSDLVIGVVVNGEAHAFPHRTLWTHEMINTTIGEVPVAVSHCPLTITSLAFDRRIDGAAMELVVSGFLFNNNLIMQDTRNFDFFPQMCTDAGFQQSGDPSSTTLDQIFAVEATWDLWKRMHPDTKVVSSESVRDQGVYPYTSQGDYRLVNNYIPFPFGPDDSRKDRKDLTFGVVVGDQTKAYALEDMSSMTVLNDVVGDRPVVVVHDADGRYNAAFIREANGQTLTFVRLTGPAGRTLPFDYYDEQTGSKWNIQGEAVDGPMEGTLLRQVTTAYVGFWFAWAAFRPGIILADPKALEKTPTTDIISSLTLEERSNAIPTTPRLHQNYPNPFNPVTTITFDVARQGDVTLRIFNMLGQKVAEFHKPQLAPGSYSIVWDGKNDRGLPVESGMYLYQLRQSNGFTETRKMMLVK